LIRAGSSSPAKGHRWGLGEAVLGFAAGVLLSAIAAGIAEAATGYHPGSGAAIPVAVTAADVAGLWVGLVGSVLLTSRIRGTGDLGRDFGWGRGRWWDLPVGAAIGLVCQYALIPLLYLPFEHIDRHLNHQLSQPVHQDTAAAHTTLAALALLLFLAVGAPIVEELFFRGLLLRSLLGRTPVPVAIVLSALLFALAHFEAVQFAGLAVFGVVLAFLAWRTGRLAPGIGAHAAFNAVAVLSVIHLS
jgi:membrane protease YdiL (CAAX protease family)